MASAPPPPSAVASSSHSQRWRSIALGVAERVQGAQGQVAGRRARRLERESIVGDVRRVHRRKNPAPSSSSGSTTQVLHPTIAARPATSGTTAS
jgi:hypothetical protein